MRIMKALLLITLTIFCYFSGSSQVVKEVTLDIPGTLSDLLGNKTDYDTLVIKGKMGYSDFHHIKDLFKRSKLPNLDIQDVIIPASEYNTENELALGALSGAYGLKSILLPKRLKKIGELSLSDCGFESITIPSSVDSIGNGAFQGSFLRKVYIEEGLKYIGNRAFFLCSLIEINIPSSVIEIAGNAIPSDVYTDIKLSRDNPSFTLVSNTIYSKNRKKIISYHPSKVESDNEYIIPEGVEEIGDYAFANFTLKIIKFPSSLRVIGNGAFSGAGYINRISIPGNVKTIGVEAFSCCNNLSTVIIENGVEEIGDYAFEYCQGLFDVNLPKSIIKLGCAIFSNCDYMSGVSVDSNNMAYVSVDGNIFTKDKKELIAFTNSQIASYNIPPGTETVGDQAFYMNKNVRELNVPNTIMELGAAALGYSFIERLKLPSSLKKIGRKTFYGMHNIKEIVIPEGIEEIREAIWGELRAIRIISFPSSLKTLYAYNLYSALNYNNKIQVFSKAIDPPSVVYNDVMIDFEISNATLYVPAKSLGQYKIHPAWGKFLDIVGISDSDFPTSVIPIPEISISIVKCEGGIIVSKIAPGTMICVYDLRGRQVASMLSCDDNRISLKSGVYVVRCGNERVKIVI